MINPPIFLRAMGRTGGTMFVTMLDAHPQIAMSYEIYQDRLFRDEGEPIEPAWAIEILQQTRNANGNRWVKQIPDKNFKIFVARARRANVDVDELLKELEQFYQEGRDFNTLDGRLDFIERLMVYKMRKIGKQFWGGKVATVDPIKLYCRHPKAHFFAMIRDGRDVLASQLNVGNFKTNARKCAREWRDGILDFRNFMKQQSVRAMMIGYETLVEKPEDTMKDVCEFIGVEYNPSTLHFHEMEMDLFKNPHGHLSHRQIKEGINANSIGRWKRDLSEEEIGRFFEIAGDLLVEYGYIDNKNIFI